MAATSLATLFLERVALTPGAPAYRYREIDGWRTISWRELADRVRVMADGLHALGVKRGDRCAILCSTRIEWIVVDLAILMTGAATTTIYPASSPADCAFILSDSGCRFAFVEDAAQLAKLTAERAQLGCVERVILIDGESSDGWVMARAAFEELGREHGAAKPEAYEAAARAVMPEDLATLIYTSGTTGRPKGVELLHDTWLFEADAIEQLKVYDVNDESLLWLPLAHVFGKVLIAAQLRVGLPSSVDGRLDKLFENIASARPSLMAGVPRVFEKMYNGIVEAARSAGGAKWRMFRWALEVGRAVSAKEFAGETPGPWLALKHRVADRLVLSKIRAKFGGRLRFFTSGSAPLPRPIGEFFHAIGLPILEGYGLTESGAASFINVPGALRYGTVGRPLPGVKVKIAADGEILIGGRGLMRGYWNNPEATRAALVDGWLHTGDIGHLDADGFLQITDRKKDLIKTSGGKFVAPQMLEAKLRLLCPQLSHVVVHGDGRNFCSALVTLDADAVRKWAAANQLAEPPGGDWTRCAPLRALVGSAVEKLNQGLASFETIKCFEILPGDFTIAGGELTTSMKVRRRIVEEKYRSILDRFYEGTVASL